MRATDVIDWRKYPNFSESEMKCKHTGLCYMSADFMDALQQIRLAYGKPMVVTSGYRSPLHPEEAKKERPGEHTFGRAVDIAVRGGDAVELLQIALAHGITRIGVNQKGKSRFLHLGMGAPGLPSPMIWSY